MCTHASSAHCYYSSRHFQGGIQKSLEVLSFRGHPKEMRVCAPLLFSPQGFLIGLLLLQLLGHPQTSAFSVDNFGFKDSHLLKSKTAFQRAFPPLAAVTLKFCTIFVCTVLTYVYFVCVHMYVCVCVFVKNQSLAFMQRGMLPNKCAYKLLFIENVTIMAT